MTDAQEQMLASIANMIELQKNAGRKIAKYAKRRRKDRNRLDGLLEFFDELPEDLIALHETYDGAVAPQTIWNEYGYFFGHFTWEASDQLYRGNRVCQRRDPFPLGDEIAFSMARRGELLITPSEDRGTYVLTMAKSAVSDVRYIAFDSIPSMVATCEAALMRGAWTFDEKGISKFDDRLFLDIASEHNEQVDYWRAVVEGSIDFGRKAYETGEKRPRTEKRHGYDMLRDRGLSI